MKGIRFEKAVLSDFCFAVQMSPKSNCIWTADNRMGGEVFFSALVGERYRRNFAPVAFEFRDQETGEIQFSAAFDAVDFTFIRIIQLV